MKNSESPLVITPELKVGELLDTYPKLKEILFDLSPTFKKLNNPALRRTVAKVTTLRHAARVGQVDLGKLINRLRAEVGQKSTTADEFASPPQEEARAPSWLSVDRISHRIDVRPLLEEGVKPVGKVMEILAELPESEICELTAPFNPAPMIELAEEKRFDSWVQQQSENLFKVYFRKRLGRTSG